MNTCFLSESFETSKIEYHFDGSAKSNGTIPRNGEFLGEKLKQVFSIILFFSSEKSKCVVVFMNSTQHQFQHFGHGLSHSFFLSLSSHILYSLKHHLDQQLLNIFLLHMLLHLDLNKYERFELIFRLFMKYVLISFQIIMSDAKPFYEKIRTYVCSFWNCVTILAIIFYIVGFFMRCFGFVLFYPESFNFWVFFFSEKLKFFK